MTGMSTTENKVVIDLLREQNRLMTELSERVGDVVTRVAVLEDARDSATRTEGNRNIMWAGIVGALVATIVEHAPHFFH